MEGATLALEKVKLCISLDSSLVDASNKAVGELQAEGIKDRNGRKMSLSGLLDILLRDALGEK